MIRSVEQDAVDNWPTVHKALASKAFSIRELSIETGLSRQKLARYMPAYSRLGWVDIIGHRAVKTMPQPIWGLR